MFACISFLQGSRSVPDSMDDQHYAYNFPAYKSQILSNCIGIDSKDNHTPHIGRIQPKLTRTYSLITSKFKNLKLMIFFFSFFFSVCQYFLSKQSENRPKSNQQHRQSTGWNWVTLKERNRAKIKTTNIWVLHRFD